MSETQTPITPIHQWTHGTGRVFLVRFVDMEHKSYGGFRWPKEIGAEVEPTTWNDKPECGGGLHGWPWGIGMGAGKDPVFVDAIWQVVSCLPADLVWLGDKAKCRKVRMEYVGSWWGALAVIEKGRDAWIHYAERGAASNSGERGVASNSGESGVAVSTGEYSTVETSGKDSIAASTANNVTWVVRPGAVFQHRWAGDKDNKPGCKVYTSRKRKDGERITFFCGKIVKRELP